jgi:hypothetical protein
MMSAYSKKFAISVFVLAGLLLFPTAVLRAEAPFTIVVIPDTQFLARDKSPAFTAQTTWIKNHVADKNIVFVTHEGDIVDTYNSPAQWANAQAAMSVLDSAGIPWGVTPGNHDMGQMASPPVYDYSSFLTNFGPTSTHFSGKSWYGGASGTGGSSYQFFTANGTRRFLSIELDSNTLNGSQVPTAALTWAQSVIGSNPGVPTLITMHNYLIPGGLTRTATDSGGATSPWGPGTYLWNNLIRKNPQIFMVLNGHTDTSRFQEDVNDAGGRVFEALADYQSSSTNSSQGYLRVITFNPDKENIHISTISSVSNTEMVTNPQKVNGHTWDYNNVDFTKLQAPARAAAGMEPDKLIVKPREVPANAKP